MRAALFVLLNLQLYTWSLAYNSDAIITIKSNELHDYINESLYDKAVTLTKKLKEDKLEVAIVKTVHEMLDGSSENLVEYAFKLWESDEKLIVGRNFPKAFKFLFNNHEIRIVNRQYKSSLFEYTTTYGDAQVWGAGCYREPKLLLWKIKPVWDNNRVYFKINNVERDNNIRLSFKYKNNDVKEAIAVVDEIESPNATLWTFEPIWSDNKMFFRFIDNEHKMVLNLSPLPNDRNDRIALGHSGVFNKDDKSYHWDIQNKVIINYYKIDKRK